MIALVLLSYFVQQKRDSSEMDSFRQQHLSRLEQMELRVADTETQLGALSARLDALESEQAELRSELDADESGSVREHEALARSAEALDEKIAAIRTELDTLLENSGN